VAWLASQNEITRIISLVRSINSFRIVDTKKNRETRYRLGITVDDQKQLIHSLTVNDYNSGPEQDYDSSRSGEIWIFKKYAYGTIFYIKIKIDITHEIRVLSCHIDNIIV
jgi:hypothetical protein